MQKELWTKEKTKDESVAKKKEKENWKEIDKIDKSLKLCSSVIV
jgi:hypothetical protein